MKNLEGIVIELVTEKGTFTFAKHFNSPASAYDAMTCFESNNWEMLGDYHYILHAADVESMTFKGLNASARLAAMFDQETAEELARFDRNNY